MIKFKKIRPEYNSVIPITLRSGTEEPSFAIYRALKGWNIILPKC